MHACMRPAMQKLGVQNLCVMLFWAHTYCCGARLTFGLKNVEGCTCQSMGKGTYAVDTPICEWLKSIGNLTG